MTGLAPAILEVSELLTTELGKPATMETLKNVGKEIGGALKGIIGIAQIAAVGNHRGFVETGWHRSQGRA